MKKNINTILYIILLITLAVAWRIINNSYHVAPNLEIVTAVSVLAAVTVEFRASIIVPIAAMVISDIIIGNTSIFIFTWASFAIIGASAIILKKLDQKPKTQIVSSVVFAASSSFLFFVITNFGVWAQGWYPATFAGLMESYVMAIPFYRTMFIGNLILVPLVISAWQLVRLRRTNKNLVIDTFIR